MGFDLGIVISSVLQDVQVELGSTIIVIVSESLAMKGCKKMMRSSSKGFREIPGQTRSAKDSEKPA
jgi:hypothetical protein